MRFFRSQRVEALIHEELSRIFVRDVEFPGALVTITTVDVDKKMERAKVYLSILPATAEEKVMRILHFKAWELQQTLLKTINIKPMPKVIFEIDHGLENAAKVEKALLEEGDEIK